MTVSHLKKSPYFPVFPGVSLASCPPFRTPIPTFHKEHRSPESMHPTVPSPGLQLSESISNPPPLLSNSRPCPLLSTHRPFSTPGCHSLQGSSGYFFFFFLILSTAVCISISRWSWSVWALRLGQTGESLGEWGGGPHLELGPGTPGRGLRPGKPLASRAPPTAVPTPPRRYTTIL